MEWFKGFMDKGNWYLLSSSKGGRIIARMKLKSWKVIGYTADEMHP